MLICDHNLIINFEVTTMFKLLSVLLGVLIFSNVSLAQDSANAHKKPAPAKEAHKDANSDAPADAQKDASKDKEMMQKEGSAKASDAAEMEEGANKK